jgi:phosphatidylserine/phosphatidylglycerophosphate/cardiolipin synthase-like enzyme
MNMKQRSLALLYLFVIVYPLAGEEKSASHLGKTHFIVGYPESKHDNVVVKSTDNSAIPYNLMCNDCVKNVYFSPNDDIRSVLLYLIEQETQYIHIAMFNFTEKKLAQALVDAQLRGVKVEVVVDQSNMYSPYGKLSILHQGQVKVFVYNTNRKSRSSLMHNKFALFGNNIIGKSLICTGSFNFTRAAYSSNEENILVLDDTILVTKYADKFEQLKESSDIYRESKNVRQVKRL